MIRQISVEGLRSSILGSLSEDYITGWYNALVLPELHLEDVLRLRKPHPCGSYTWKVVRLGADIGLECLGCGRRVLLPRRDLAHRLKAIISTQTTAGQNE